MITVNSFLGYVEKKVQILSMERHFDSVTVQYNNGSDILLQSDGDFVEFLMNHHPDWFTEWHYSAWENAVASARYYVDLMLEEF